MLFNYFSFDVFLIIGRFMCNNSGWLRWRIPQGGWENASVSEHIQPGQKCLSQFALVQCVLELNAHDYHNIIVHYNSREFLQLPERICSWSSIGSYYLECRYDACWIDRLKQVGCTRLGGVVSGRSYFIFCVVFAGYDYSAWYGAQPGMSHACIFHSYTARLFPWRVIS